MGIKLNISNVKIGGSARMLNNATMTNLDCTEIGLHDIEINGQAQLLENLEIKPVIKENNVDGYARVKEVPEVKQWDIKKFWKCVVAHLKDFLKDVLASIIANHITKL